MSFIRARESATAVYRRVQAARDAEIARATEQIFQRRLVVSHWSGEATHARQQARFCRCKKCSDDLAVAEANYALALERLNVAKEELTKLSKETRREYSLRWAARGEADRAWLVEKKRREEEWAKKIWLNNRFWAMHRLGLVEEMEPWARPYPDPKPPSGKHSRQWRVYRDLALARQQRKEAREAFNPHEGKMPKIQRQKIRWSELVVLCGWEWDRFAHTLELTPGELPQLRAFERLFPQVRDALLSAKKKVEETPPPLPQTPPPDFVPQLDVPEELVEMIRRFDARKKARLEAQMDNSAEGVANSNVQITQTQNTIQLDAASTSEGAHVPVGESDQTKLCGPCTAPSSDALSERMFCFATETWKTTNTVSSVIVDKCLPADIIDAHSDQPNFAYFNQHRYWRGDMEVEIRVNSNVRQFGQLLATFWYSYDQDQYANLRDNVYTASANMHCLITANTSNVGRLEIPYKFVRPYLDLIRPKVDKKNKSRADLGKFKIYVLVPLKVSNTGAQSCSVSCFIRFKNVCYMGTLHRSIVVPQMFTALMAAELLKYMKGDDNRDRPVNPANPTHVKAITNTNWAAGTGQAITSAPLRLNPRGVLPYGPGRASLVDEMQVSFVAGTFGLLKQVDWTAQHTTGTMLTSVEATPMLKENFYATREFGGKTLRCLPPVAVVASMFKMWRGELELRFDVVGPTEITGRLMVSFVPISNECSYEQCMASDAAYIDVAENRSFTYVVPYESDRAWRLRKYRVGDEEHETQIMGFVHVYVVNKLIANQTIPDRCTINIYVRGSPTFEVAVPIQPTVFLPWDLDVWGGRQVSQITFKAGYYPVYVGNWRFFLSNEACIFRYGETTDHIAQLEDHAQLFIRSRYFAATKKKAAKYGILRIVGSDNPKEGDNNTIHATYKQKGGNITAPMKIEFCVPWWIDNTYMYLLPAFDQDHAIAMSMDFLVNGPANIKKGRVLQWTRNSDYFKIQGEGNFKMNWVDFSWTGAQGDERFNAPNALNTETRASTSGYGMSTHGESFGDLKDVIRRIELYMERSRPIQNRGGVASLLVPVLPQGLELDIGKSGDPNPMSNFSRHSLMQLISSGYRFYAGSMNMQVKCTCGSDYSGFFIQHRPYPTHVDRNAISTEGINGTTYATFDTIYGRGAATYTQDEKNSSVAEITVPYYLETECAYLQVPNVDWFRYRPQERNYLGLGHLAIGPMPGTEKEGKQRLYSVWAAAGDDMRFFTFQGFPPMMFIEDPEPFIVPFSGSIRSTAPKYAIMGPRQRRPTPSSVVSSDFEEVEAQMYIPLISDLMDVGKNFKNAGERIDRLTAQLDEIDVKEVVEGTLTDVKETAQYTGYFSFLYNAISNIVHCIINPCWRTLTWAVASMMQYLFDLKSCLVERFTNTFQKLFSMLSRPFGSRNVTAEPEPTFAAEEALAGAGTSKTDFRPAFVTALVTGGGGTATTVQMPRAEYESKLRGQADDEAVAETIDLDTGFVEGKSFLRKHCAALISVLITCIMTYLGYNAWKGEFDNKFTDLLFKLVRTFTSTANGLLTFFKGMMELILDTFDWAVAYVCPSWKSLGFLAKYDSDLFKWAKSVQFLTDGRNRNAVLTNPVYVSRLYCAANEACLIQQKLLAMDKKFEGPQMMVLNTLIKDIMKLRDFASGLHIAPPCKFEPFVLQLAGPPKIGKSHIMQSLPIDLLDEVGYKTYNEPIYNRAPGNDYWNGLVNQPIVVYDDFLAIMDPAFSTTQLSELFQLKTNCVFNPPMAAVDDKNIRYNPIIVGLCSNAAFWDVCGVLDPQAVHRRRDMLFEVNLKKEYPNIDAVPQDVLYEYGHLLFYLYKDPTNPDSRASVGMEYKDFIRSVTQSFTAYYRAETIRYKSRSAKLFRLAPKLGEKEFTFANHSVGEDIDRYYQRMAGSGSRDDQLLKCLLTQMRGMSPWKRQSIMKKFWELVAPNKVDPPPFKATEQHSDAHILDTLIRAYIDRMGKPDLTVDQVKADLEVNLNSLKNVLYNDAQRVDIIKTLSGQMDIDALDEVEKNTHPNDMRQTSLFHTLPYGCVHEGIMSSNLVNSTLLFHNATGLWKVFRGEVLLTKSELDACIKVWQELVEDNVRILVSEEGDDIIQFPNKPCKFSKCPFSSIHTRNYFTYRYIESNPAILHMYTMGDDRLNQYLPPEFVASGTTKETKNEEEEKKTWTQWVRDLRDKILPQSWSTIFKIIGWIITAIGTILGLYKFFCPKKQEAERPAPTVTEEEVIPLVGQARMSDAEYDAWKAIQNAKKAFKPKTRMGKGYRNVTVGRKYGSGRFKGHMDLRDVMNPSIDSVVTALVKRNTIFISACRADTPDRPVIARCLGIAERVAIFPNHYYDVWQRFSDMEHEDGVRFVFELIDPSVPQPIPLNFEELQISVGSSNSIGFIKFPPKTRMFKDMRAHLALYEDEPKKFGATLYELKYDKVTHEYDLTKVKVQAEFFGSAHVQKSQIFDEFRVHSSYAYSYGGPGVCGSLLVDRHGKIVAMHVAGRDGEMGLAEIIDADDIKYLSQLMDLKGEIEFDEEDVFPVQYLQGYVPKVDTRISVIGVVRDDLRNAAVPFTSLRPSRMTKDLAEAGFVRKTEPAVLSRKDERIAHDPFDPLKEGVFFHGAMMKEFPLDVVEEVQEDFKNFIISNAQPVMEAQVITEEQSIMGIAGLESLDSLDFTSSSGWPFRCDPRPKAAQKSSWIELDYEDGGPKLKSIDPELREVMDVKHAQRLAGEVPLTVFADVLKDETLPREKAIRKGGTRVVSMSPIDFTIQQRMYTLAFVASYMHHRLKLEHAIGINSNSKEWTTLWGLLVGQNRQNFIAADYSKFGDKLPPRLGKFCFKIIADWYRKNGCKKADELEQILTVMAEEVFSAKHIVGNTLYQTLTGMPSGNTMTVIFNSMVNSLFMRIAWVLLTEGTKFSGLDNYYKCVTVFSYGDDLIVSVEEAVANIFNTVAISELFAQYDLKFTDADKEGVMRPFRTVEELVFLKRGWMPIPKSVKLKSLRGILLAPLDKDTVEQVPFWVHKTMDDLDGSVCLMEEALRLAFSHGPEYYDALRAKYRKIAEKHNRAITAPAWTALACRTYISGLPITSYRTMTVQDLADHNIGLNASGKQPYGSSASG